MGNMPSHINSARGVPAADGEGRYGALGTWHGNVNGCCGIIVLCEDLGGTEKRRNCCQNYRLITEAFQRGPEAETGELSLC